MNKPVTLSIEEILSKEFSVDFKGYAPIEVDQFLDAVMADYKAYEDLIAQLEEKLNESEKAISSLKSRVVEVEGQSISRVANSALSQDSSSNQVDLLKRLSRLEQEVFGGRSNNY